jgi:nitroreductase
MSGPGRKQNGTIVLDHAVLAATSLGYGTCWIGAYDEAQVKEVLGIPADHGLICLVPVGLPAEEPPARSRKAPKELYMLDQFGKPLDYSL